MRYGVFRLWGCVVCCVLCVSVTPVCAMEIDLCCDNNMGLGNIDLPSSNVDCDITDHHTNIVFKENTECSIAKVMDNSTNIQHSEEYSSSKPNLKIYLCFFVIVISLIIISYGIVHNYNLDQSYASKTGELDVINSKGPLDEREAVYNSEMRKVEIEFQKVNENIARNMGEINARNVPNQNDHELMRANLVAFHEWREDLIYHRTELELEREDYLRDLEVSDAYDKWIKEVYDPGHSWGVKMISWGAFGAFSGTSSLLYMLL